MVAPYATMLAMQADPAAYKNLKDLKGKGQMGLMDFMKLRLYPRRFPIGEKREL